MQCGASGAVGMSQFNCCDVHKYEFDVSGRGV